MALLPVGLSSIFEDPWGPLFDQSFDLGLLPSDVMFPALAPSRGYYRPWRHLLGDRSGVSKIVDQKDSFKVHLDVQQFKPEEIKVKVVDNFLHIEGKHEERRDKHGFISREFTRRYAIPEGVDVDAIASELSSDGVLTVTAPKKALPEAQNEKVIPIMQTNAPALGVKAESGDKTHEFH